MEYCKTYYAFGDCYCEEYGLDEYFHGKRISDQECFAATIESPVTANGNIVQIARWHKSERVFEDYYVPSGEWHTKGAQQGDMVIFQASSELMHKYDLNFGRVVHVLHRNYHEICEKIPVESLKQDAFTIDPPGCGQQDDAITIEDCLQHSGGCKKIGIHVTAVALGHHHQWRCRPPTLPIYMQTRHFLYDEEKKYWSFENGKVVLAISVYVHTQTGEVSGPTFTPIEIGWNYWYSDKEQFKDEFDILWSHFVGESAPSKMLGSTAFLYVADFPKDWKMLFLVDEMMATFTRAITEFLRSKKSVYIITKPLTPLELAQDKTVCVTQDFLGNAEQSFTGESKDDTALLRFAAICQANMNPKVKVNYFLQRYETDIELSSQLRVDSAVKCTSPLRKFHHFVDQQILISCMINSTPIYKEEDLLGLIVIRHNTPILAKPSVKNISENTAVLRYRDWYGKPPNKILCQISFKNFSYEDKKVTEFSGGQKLDITLKNITCEDRDFCNRLLGHIDGAKFEKFSKEMQKGNFSPSSLDMIDLFQQMTATKTEEQSPYRRAGKDTILSLQKGAELQLQVSNRDACDNNDMGLRLLRIGKNCHLCFTHIHFPEKAFMSDRKDIRNLITTEKIEAFRKVKMEQKLDSVKLYDVPIHWNSEYYSGGSFASSKEATVGDLLCIRKEVFDNEEVKYVWTCHAVVSGFKTGMVNFLTCTLSQAEIDRDGTTGFCIEIMH